jgi:hypothetical protein
MPFASPDNAPRPQLAPWLLAGVVVSAVVALLDGAVWYLAPLWLPAQTLQYSLWLDPAMRTAVAIEERSPGVNAGSAALQMWAQTPERCANLVPYLSGADPIRRRLAMEALAALSDLNQLPAVDAALRDLLHDPDRSIRLLAVEGLTDPASIPALEALRDGPDEGAIEAVERVLARLRVRPPR